MRKLTIQGENTSRPERAVDLPLSPGKQNMTFKTQSVVKITGLTFRQVDYWDRVCFLRPSLQGAHGRGTERLYSFNDLVRLAVAKTLLVKGIHLNKIRLAVEYLKRCNEMSKPLTDMKFLTDGESIFVLTDDTGVILNTLSKGTMVVFLAIGEIIRDLSQKVEGMTRGPENPLPRILY